MSASVVWMTSQKSDCLRRNERKRQITVGKQAGSNRPPEGPAAIMRHMGVVSTLAIGIGGGAWLGHRWDESAGHDVAWGTALCAMLGLAAAFTSVIRSLKS